MPNAVCHYNRSVVRLQRIYFFTENGKNMSTKNHYVWFEI